MTTVWAWEKTVVMLKHPGHLTSIKNEFGDWTRRLSLCFRFSDSIEGLRRSTASYLKVSLCAQIGWKREHFAQIRVTLSTSNGATMSLVRRFSKCEMHSMRRIHPNSTNLHKKGWNAVESDGCPNFAKCSSPTLQDTYADGNVNVIRYRHLVFR